MKRIFSVTQKDYWKRIGYISLLLAVFVVIRHNSAFANYDTAAGNWFHAFLQETITALAVPMFFVISGFNFFRNYTLKDYPSKLRKRVKSLLIPYLLWNAIYCAFNIVTSYTAISRFFIGREKFVLTVPNVIYGVFYHWLCNSHFWFVFDLMLFAVLSPLLYLLLKKKWVGLASILGAFVAIFVLNWKLPMELIYRTDAVFYYLFGGFLAIHFGRPIFSTRQIESGETASHPKNTAIRLLLGGLLTAASFLMALEAVPGYFHPFIILVGCAGLWIISGIVATPKVKRVPPGGTVFLLYAMHGITQPIFVKLLYLALPKQPTFSVLNFVLSFTITVVFCFLLRMPTRRFLPSIDHALTGWRK